MKSTQLAALLAITTSAFAIDAAVKPNALFKLLASDGAAGDWFGKAVAISAEHVVVGSMQDDDNGEDSGSAYVFDAMSGQELLKLLPSDGAAGDHFGTSVAVSGALAIAGASRDSDYGTNSGSAYVFDVTTGQQIWKLLPSDGSAQDQFGTRVSLSGNTAVVGSPWDDDNGNASGSAYVFDAITGQERFKLLPTDGNVTEFFGSDVAVSGVHAVIGAPADDDNGENSGSAYVFDVTTGQQIYKLLPSDGSADDHFGASVAVSGNLTVVGAFSDNDAPPYSGSAYVFDVTTGQQLFKLLPIDGAADDSFGWGVSISGNRIVVGAFGEDDNGGQAGSTYLFDATTGSQLLRLNPADAAPGDGFGQSVSISGDRAVIGVKSDTDGNFADPGFAYVFSTPQVFDVPFCFGDGTATACPCGNAGPAGQACVHSGGVGGMLTAGGSTSASADDLTFLTAILPGQPALLFTGTRALNGMHGVPFGDGVRCVGGIVVRHGIQIPDAGGVAIWGPGLGALVDWTVGETSYYQVWFRDPGGPCGSGFNLTNAVSVLIAL